MFNDPYLKHHLDFSQSLYVETAVFMELNQNYPLNVDTLGVFKYDDPVANNTQIRKWNPTPEEYFYRHDFVTSYMNRDIYNEEVVYFGRRPKAEYFNLADCFTEFRPRSGIVKAVRPLADKQVYVDNFWSANRPRYYFPSTRDSFKYWTSWNTDDKTKINVGLSDASGNIKNAAPFIVYKEARPVNKVTLKIQTGIGIKPKPELVTANKVDPLVDLSKSSIPEKMVIEFLNPAGTWERLFDIQTGGDIFPHDSGTIDLAYMVKNPDPISIVDFIFKGFFPSPAHLPENSRNGDAWGIVEPGSSALAELYVREDFKWVNRGFMEHEWKIINPSKDNPENYGVRQYVDPKFYNPVGGDADDAFKHYYEFVVMKGIRVIVTKMYAPSRAFDLIELSPRLFINISDSVIEYSVEKAIAEDDVLPVGEVSVSTGNITVDNSKLMFNVENDIEFDYTIGLGSLTSNRINRNTKITFFNIVRHVPKLNELYDYFIPLKTLYVMEKPVVLSGDSEAYMPLRDLIFRFEETKCPNLVLKDCTLSKAIATLLDSIGFSNYIFQFSDDTSRNDSALETIIPYFFINEEMTVADVLQSLAMATQSAMFFDEYNNFVVMPRSHFGSGTVDTLRGSDDLVVTEENPEPRGRANIEEISAISVDMVGDVEIKYTARDLNRQDFATNQFGQYSTNQGGFAFGEKRSFLGYARTPLWSSAESADAISLGAAVLNSNLSNLRPVYSPTAADAFTNITMDVGLWAQYLPWAGMVMMNGEVIKYDAQQISMGGGLYWVASQGEFLELRNSDTRRKSNQSLFDQVAFRTGLLRIWVDVEEDEEGNTYIIRDGRGLYGTALASHEANPVEWLNAPVYKHTDSMLTTVYSPDRTVNLGKYNFVRKSVPLASPPSNAAKTTVSTDTKVTNYIYNPVHSQFNPLKANPILITPDQLSTTTGDKRVMRSSSLTFAGPSNAQANTVYKKLKLLAGNQYSTFGCRMGIIGTATGSESAREQSPYGELPLGNYIVNEDNEIKTVSGAGGGLCFYTNRIGSSVRSNDGYYFEISALNSDYSVTPDQAEGGLTIFANVNFYKINSGVPKAGDAGKGATEGDVAISLFQTYMYIQVTTGQSAARNRLGLDNADLIHDLAVDVKETVLSSGTYRTFYLYVDNVLIGTVVDATTKTGYLPYKYDHTEFGIYTRGRATIQFEHLYAIGGDISVPNNVEYNTSIYRRPPEFKLFSPSALWAAKSLTGGPANQWRYFEEFGTIARECKKINAQFSLYPAFIPSIQKLQMNDRAYAITHYESSPYGASFMLWSQNDSIIDLREPGVAITIAGLTLADNQEQSLKLDDYLVGQFAGTSALNRFNSGVEKRNELLTKRLSGQTSDISYDSIYIQSTEYAIKLMHWFSGFVGLERMRLELKTFGTQHLQLGDIVKLNYQIPHATQTEAAFVSQEEWNPTLNEFATLYFDFDGNNSKKFIVRKISTSNSGSGPETSVSLVEIPPSIPSGWDAGDW